jgi:hypothetical protein
MKLHSLLSFLASVSTLTAAYALAGESPYNPGGAANVPAGQSQAARPAEQNYSYYAG